MIVPTPAHIFASRWQLRECRRGLPIFVYHCLGAPLRGTPDRFLYVTPQRFEEQLTALQTAGFSTTSLSDIGHRATGSAGQCVITFDDGCRNVFAPALDLLAGHRFRAMQFLVADLLGQDTRWDALRGFAPEPLADAVQIREWLAAGHEIGSHSLTHPSLPTLGTDAAREEISASRQRLEDLFGVPVRHFCYPFGHWDARIRDLVGEAGYETACTTRFGVNTAATARHALHRIFPLSVGELWQKAIDRLAKRLLPAPRSFSRS